MDIKKEVVDLKEIIENSLNETQRGQCVISVEYLRDIKKLIEVLIEESKRKNEDLKKEIKYCSKNLKELKGIDCPLTIERLETIKNYSKKLLKRWEVKSNGRILL